MMNLPDYWLDRPAMNPDARHEFDQLLMEVKFAKENTLIQYRLPYPKWQFLCHVADHHAIALHGTGDGNISVFEPRQANDLGDFGNQNAVYAAGDGLWPMYYAVVDRDRYRMSLTNACIRLTDKAGNVSEPKYVFSISQTALPQQPWRSGFVYLLPSETFTVQPSIPFGEYEVQIPQLASPVSVTPLGRLEVTPEDFPFLSQIRGHDDSRLGEYGQAMQTGAPWPN
jgi:hypothetical protein